MAATEDGRRSPLGSTAARARLLTIVWLVSSALSILLLPLVGIVRESSPTLRLAGTLGIAAFFVATLSVLWSAVTPWISRSTHARTQATFAVTAVATLPLVAPVAAGEWATWAWLGAAVVGATPLLWRWPLAIAVPLLATAASAGSAALLGGSVLHHLVVTAGIGGTLAAINWTPVWLWELLVRAETSQASRAELAAAEERLHFARDVHDVLGHDLTVIALQSELASRTVRTDPETSARASADVRRRAETALDRVRATAAGYREVDLPAELHQVARLLGTAGVQCEVQVEVEDQPVPVAPSVAGALSAVAKEATTNVLRHSSARRCAIALTRTGDRVVLTVANDGVRPARSSVDGSGLAGMGSRLAPFGGGVRAQRAGDTFTLRAEVPAQP